MDGNRCFPERVDPRRKSLCLGVLLGASMLVLEAHSQERGSTVEQGREPARLEEPLELADFVERNAFLLNSDLQLALAEARTLRRSAPAQVDEEILAVALACEALATVSLEGPILVDVMAGGIPGAAVVSTAKNRCWAS